MVLTVLHPQQGAVSFFLGGEGGVGRWEQLSSSLLERNLKSVDSYKELGLWLALQFWLYLKPNKPKTPFPSKKTPGADNSNSFNKQLHYKKCFQFNFILQDTES